MSKKKREWKLTEEDFSFFKDEVFRYIAQFGLLDWDVEVGKKDLSGREQHGDIFARTKDKTAYIRISSVWNEPLTQKLISKTAFHEVCGELLLMPMYREAEARFTTQTAIDVAAHGVIRRLENAVFEREWAEREREQEHPDV